MSTTAFPQLAEGQFAVAGSLAFDHIMDFPGHFKDHILPERLHVINISFLVERLEKQRGGCAGNIAYTMALLGERPLIVAAAGTDFDDYKQWLEDEGIDTGGILVSDEEVTASCFITTDRADCQITGFYPGAMARAADISLAETAGRCVAAVVAPDDPQAMMRHCREARESGLAFLFDPSFQVTAMDGEDLASASEGALALFLNDYEYTVFRDKTGLTEEELRQRHGFVVVTLGALGSRILLADGELEVPAAQASEVIDPTGAGDAYRGGFVAGLARGHDLAICGRMGSVAAVYAVESYGTQKHRYSQEEFFARYRQSFGEPPE